MVVGTAGDQPESSCPQRIGECACVVDDLFGVCAEAGLQGFGEADSFGGDDVHQWSALNSGEDGFIDGGGMFFAAENEA